MSSTTGSSEIDSGMPAATVAGPGEATKSARPRRTWTSSARIERAISSAVSAPRSRPAGARSAAIRSSPMVVSSRSQSRTTAARVGEATRPTYEASRVRASPTASSSQMPWLATTTYGEASGSRPRMSADAWTRAAGKARLGDRIDDGHASSRRPSRGRRGRRRSAWFRRSRVVARADAVPRRSPACHRSGRS